MVGEAIRMLAFHCLGESSEYLPSSFKAQGKILRQDEKAPNLFKTLIIYSILCWHEHLLLGSGTFSMAEEWIFYLLIRLAKFCYQKKKYGETGWK